MLLVAAAFGIAGWPWLIAAVGIDVAVVWTAFSTHHDLLRANCSRWSAASPSDRGAARARLGVPRRAADLRARVTLTNPYARGLAALLIATGVSVGGGLIVVGLLSTPRP